MPRHLRITVLMEHRSLSGNLATERGLSLWIEADGVRIPFDTGQGGAFADNARTLLQAARITGDPRCAFLIGGLHLGRSGAEQIWSVLDILNQAGTQGVLSGHCTGLEAEHRFGTPTRQGPGLPKGLLEVGARWELDMPPSGPLVCHSCPTSARRIGHLPG